MRYMFDTNMCIYLIKNQPKEIAERFALCRLGDVVISSITYAELEFGAAAAANPAKEANNLASLIQDIPVLPFDVTAAKAYGPIRLATRETKKDAMDKLIAAHAVSVGAILVTNNQRDFEKYPNLIVENWLSESSKPMHH
jgi:tRNA(fMet)-specific endonuclease VapC